MHPLDPAVIAAMKLAAATGKPVFVTLLKEPKPIRHECEGEIHEGLKINCDVYQRFLRDCRTFAQSEGNAKDKA